VGFEPTPASPYGSTSDRGVSHARPGVHDTRSSALSQPDCDERQQVKLRPRVISVLPDWTTVDGTTRFHRQDSNLNLSRDKRSNSPSQPVAYYVVEPPTT